MPWPPHAPAGKLEYILTKKGEEFHRVILSIKRFNVKWGNAPKECLTTPCVECNLYKN
jgi:DNA-binding HxlR family transcriptional regulator